jgi:serine phosphatase RsbU (regulator of sigma subunit)
MGKLMAGIDFGMCYRAMLGPDSECGDITFMKQYDNQCFFAVIDVLGHGAEARKVAVSAEKYLEENYKGNLIDVINGIHQHLKGTRGAVVALCHLEILTGELTYIGIGNITVRILGLKTSRLTPKGGIVGYKITTPRSINLKLYQDDIVLMYSDGIKEHFDIVECAALLKEEAQDIAYGILKQFGKKNDDASCIAIKYLS